MYLAGPLTPSQSGRPKGHPGGAGVFTFGEIDLEIISEKFSVTEAHTKTASGLTMSAFPESGRSIGW